MRYIFWFKTAQRAREAFQGHPASWTGMKRPVYLLVPNMQDIRIAHLELERFIKTEDAVLFTCESMATGWRAPDDTVSVFEIEFPQGPSKVQAEYRTPVAVNLEESHIVNIIAVEIRGEAKIVLTQGQNVSGTGDYAAYIGSSESSDHVIASSGAKLRKKEAIAFFPRHLTSEDQLRA